MERNYKVYILTLSDGRVYIGMTRQKLCLRCRKSAYAPSTVIGKAIEEFGMKSFKVGVIADNLTKYEAEKLEMETIARYDSTNPLKGFNVALGGNIAGRHSITTRKKMSEGQKGRKFSEEHLSRMRKPKLNGALRRTVLQYDLDGNFIREYESVYAAAERVGGWWQSISKCCHHRQHTCCGYKWEYGRRGVVK